MHKLRIRISASITNEYYVKVFDAFYILQYKYNVIMNSSSFGMNGSCDAYKVTHHHRAEFSHVPLHADKTVLFFTCCRRKGVN